MRDVMVQIEAVMELPPVLKLTLTGSDNTNYVGTLYLRNASDDVDNIDSSPPAAAGLTHLYSDAKPLPHPVFSHASGHNSADPNGATYYVVAVVLVYGFSIVLLIASHIKRKNAKALQDRQINKYLQEFQVVRETSSRDRYRKLKRDITAKLTYERLTLPNSAVVGKTAAASYRALTKAALLPLTAVALPTIRESADAARRTLSDSQSSRSKFTSAPATCRTGRAVRPVSTLRPCLAALPMRSWNSDDSNILAWRGSGNDVTSAESAGSARRARLCRNEHVDETASSVVAPFSIPIIISSPDDCDDEVKPAGCAPHRRSSYPSPLYDKLTAVQHETSVSSKESSSQRLDVLDKDAPDTGSALQSVAIASEFILDEAPEIPRAKSCRAERNDESSQCQTEVVASSLGVHWPTRRLSLPHSPTSITNDCSYLQLPVI